ncbi:MAG TPA: class I SAM-dependent methyltransferase [Thermoplasmata archaeon]|nr:class I SAM-dependent methyltransferase [Thermoplasmata archaeon]
MPGASREADSESVDRLRPHVERARAFVGWNLDRVSPKQIGPGLPWDYKRRAKELLAGASYALDLGTGGGELLAELCKAYRGRAVASEPWAVNAPIAKRALSHLRIEVVRAHSLQLPFPDGAFDLVLDRHEEMDPSEVHRVLAPGGRVCTQQVGRNEWNELRPFFPRMQDFGPLLDRYTQGFRQAGMIVARAETRDIRVAYRGLGELVHLLCISPWTIPDFDPLGRDLASLRRVEDRLMTPNGVALTESRFIIEARKPS